MYQGHLQPVSNRATWREVVEIYDDETGELIDLTDADIVVEVRHQETQTSKLRATVGDGVTVLETGKFEFQFARSTMTAVCSDVYDVGITITRDDETTQLFLGTVPVLDGVVAP